MKGRLEYWLETGAYLTLWWLILMESAQLIAVLRDGIWQLVFAAPPLLMAAKAFLKANKIEASACAPQ
jgi:hypothetical protein